MTTLLPFYEPIGGTGAMIGRPLAHRRISVDPVPPKNPFRSNEKIFEIFLYFFRTIYFENIGPAYELHCRGKIATYIFSMTHRI